jgi:type II secretory pathway pseudopilin PulG
VKKKSEGYALVLTMILLVVLSLLGTAILSIAYGESKMVANQVENKRAYYAARSGADAMASYIIDNSSNSNIATIVSNLITKTSSNPGTGTVGSNTFAVQVSNINSGPYSGDLLIESQGTADAGNLPVTVYLTLKQAVKIALDMAVFADDGMCFGKNITVTGDVGTNSDSITFGKNPINGDVILGPDTSDAEMTIADAMSGNPQKLTSKIIFPDTKATLFPTENNEVFLGTEKKVKGKTVITPYVVTSNPSDQSNKVLATAVTNLSDAMEYIEWPADGGG